MRNSAQAQMRMCIRYFIDVNILYMFKLDIQQSSLNRTNELMNAGEGETAETFAIQAPRLPKHTSTPQKARPSLGWSDLTLHQSWGFQVARPGTVSNHDHWDWEHDLWNNGLCHLHGLTGSPCVPLHMSLASTPVAVKERKKKHLY